MVANPIELITGLATADNVSKSEIVAWAKARVAQVLANAAELKNTVLAGQLLVQLKSTGRVYKLDTADTTTADDGVNCIISSDGKRFKLLSIVGVDGRDAGINFKWNAATTDTDPGAGKFLVTGGNQLNISETDDAGNALAAILATWDDSTNSTKGRLYVSKVAGAALKIITISGTLTDAGTYDTFPISVATFGTFNDNDECYMFFVPDGNAGTNGTNGTNGINGTNGADGKDPGVLLTWDAGTTDVDPGTGEIAANNASLAAATFLYISKTSRGGSNISAFLATLDDSTNATKGTLILTKTSNDTQATFTVGAVTDAVGYIKLAVSDHSGATSFIAVDAISFQFSRTGDVGPTGGGITMGKAIAAAIVFG